MKSRLSYGVALLVFILTLSGPALGTVVDDVFLGDSGYNICSVAFAQLFSDDGHGKHKAKAKGSDPESVPEPGTAVLLGALAASGLVVRKITKR